MKNDALYKGIIAILIANAINMTFSLFNGFVLPKYLSFESYAYIKTYQLYLSYIGILHFGFIDGVYLKYGGKSIKDLERRDLSSQHGSLLVFQMIITIAMIIISLIIKDYVFFAVSLTVVPYNLTQYYRLLYQAVGEFSEYSKLMNITSALLFTGNIALLLFFHSDNGYHYLILYVTVYYIIWILSEWIVQKKYIRFSWLIIRDKKNLSFISGGFLLMLGNFSSILLTSIDRWYIKILMNTYAFAQYSFAVSIENMLSVVVTPLSTTLYNYFCTRKKVENHIIMQDVILVFSTFIIVSFFPVKFIVKHFIINYTDSLYVLVCLFAANIFFTIIKCVYVNIYKAQKRQNTYFLGLLITIIIGVILNALIYYLSRRIESFAVATLISSVIWFLICQHDLKRIKMNYVKYVYLFLNLTSFIVTGCFLNTINGLVGYVFIWMLSSFFLMHTAINRIKSIVLKNFLNIIR